MSWLSERMSEISTYTGIAQIAIGVQIISANIDPRAGEIAGEVAKKTTEVGELVGAGIDPLVGVVLVVSGALGALAKTTGFGTPPIVRIKGV